MNGSQAGLDLAAQTTLVVTPAAAPPAPAQPRHGQRRRQNRPRGRTLSVRRLARLATEQLTSTDIGLLGDRPRTWGECRGQDGPCPWVGCRHHLYLDVNPETGSLKLNFPDLDPLELAEPCTLRLASAGEMWLVDVGRRLNLTRERTRQIEIRALGKLRGEE